MSARNRRLPRHLSWPSTTSDISDALGLHMTRIGNLGFRGDPSNDGTLLRVGWVPPVTSSYGIGTGMPARMQVSRSGSSRSGQPTAPQPAPFCGGKHCPS
jgi:hypothetical protein